MEKNDIPQSTCNNHVYMLLAHLRINEFDFELFKIGKKIIKELQKYILALMKNSTGLLSKREI